MTPIVMLAALAAGCERSGSRIPGSGVAASETRAVPPFTEISLEGPIRLDVSIGDPKPLAVTADDNLLPLLETEVTGDRLVARTTQNVDPDVGISITASVSDLRVLSGLGGGTVRVAGLANDGLRVNVTGGYHVVLSGTTTELSITVTGAGHIDAVELEAGQVDVRVAGAGSVLTHAVETLDADISGAGIVTYRGDPVVTKKLSGIGVVRKED